MIFVGYDKNLLDFRVLEDDTVTVYGTCIGLYSYKPTMRYYPYHFQECAKPVELQ